MSDGDLPAARVVRDDLAAPPPTPDSKFEADLAAFSRANHHRWAIAWAGAAIAFLGLAFVLALIAYISPELGESRYPAGEVYRAWVYAAGAVVVAAVLGWRAARVWRGGDDAFENLQTTSADGFEAELAQFTTQARHRDVFILAIASAVCFALAVVIAVVGVAAKQGSDHTWAAPRGVSGELRMVLYAAMFVVGGAFFARSAYQRARAT